MRIITPLTPSVTHLVSLPVVFGLRGRKSAG
jgi:hypothetical protein